MTTVERPTLTEFLLARVADDEAIAVAASGWRTLSNERDHTWAYFNDGRPCHHDTDVGVWSVGRSPSEGRTDVALNLTDERARHIAHWDPARVLVECGTKRRLLEECGTVGPVWPLRLLALPYADHPDYRQEWRP